MRIRVLGSGAGGGVPQWNCVCPNCTAARSGDSRVRPRTQDSLALTTGDGAWVLLNASPDIRQQIAAAPALHPMSVRGSPIRAVVLTNGDLDHVLGLFCMRESTPFVVYATEAVLRGLLDHNAICRTLRRNDAHVVWRPLALDVPVDLQAPDGEPLHVRVRAFSLPGKVPAHLEGIVSPSAEDNIGLCISDVRDRGFFVYAPSFGAPADLAAQARGARVLFADGTFHTEDELARFHRGAPPAAQMAHMPIGGHNGTLRLLREIEAGRCFYTHVNNTNPVLEPTSPERAQVESAGIALAEDGLEVIL